MFSVIVPLYNKAAYIDRTLASVAAQTLDDYEVVVVDDGSTDDGPARVRRAGERVRLLRQVNSGPGAARNRGIEAAKGDWIAFLDADDLWSPSHLETLAGTIASCPEADVVATGFTRDSVLPHGGNGSPRYIDFFREHDAVWTSTTAVRSTALIGEQFSRIWPGEDVDLWIRLALRHRFAVSPRQTALYVQGTGGIMDSMAETPVSTIAELPVFATITAILADTTLAERHAEVAAFRVRLLLDYARPALFNGQTKLARAYLREVNASGCRAPLLYRLLAHLPPRMTSVGSRTFGKIRRVFA